MFLLAREGLDTLFAELRRRGHSLVGPTVRDGAIVYDTIQTTQDLPEGWTDEQEAGRYRLKRRADRALFGYVLGPHAWKRFLQPPSMGILAAEKTAKGLVFATPSEPTPRFAFVGARPCELAAMATQDRIFFGGKFALPAYRDRRHAAFVLAVHCTEPGGTCFCASLGTGPLAESGFDLALTELLDEKAPRYLLEVGSPAGGEVAAALGLTAAPKAELERGRQAVAAARERMGRSLATDGLAAALAKTYEHPHWQEVARRCLTCGNCTMVCPTCFCATIEDSNDLAGARAERHRRWDSCFNIEFSYLHGGSVRYSPESRYRQWLLHKLSTWVDQFGTYGCVGCGRCITWCPVGIDITAEARALVGGGTAAPGGRAEEMRT